ncbi:hypothetical protein MAMMFC1_01840 [Methylomusa anaerophila]|uniref:Uncharacterized protein n=1 Tax=Methylomusa anaerophila TaxID=1930071 RepID=A0A348AJC1_9FIRM|nr:hypothetical protein MAMMFC1_01840 [Methylomusa anaerophila]
MHERSKSNWKEINGEKMANCRQCFLELRKLQHAMLGNEARYLHQ